MMYKFTIEDSDEDEVYYIHEDNLHEYDFSSLSKAKISLYLEQDEDSDEPANFFDGEDGYGLQLLF